MVTSATLYAQTGAWHRRADASWCAWRPVNSVIPAGPRSEELETWPSSRTCIKAQLSALQRVSVEPTRCSRCHTKTPSAVIRTGCTEQRLSTQRQHHDQCLLSLDHSQKDGADLPISRSQGRNLPTANKLVKPRACALVLLQHADLRLRSLLLPLMMVLSRIARALPRAKFVHGFTILSIMEALLAQRVVVTTDVNQHILFSQRTSFFFLNRLFLACFVLVTVKLTVLASNVVF